MKMKNKYVKLKDNNLKVGFNCHKYELKVPFNSYTQYFFVKLLMKALTRRGETMYIK